MNHPNEPFAMTQTRTVHRLFSAILTLAVLCAAPAVNAADVVFLCVGYNNADVEREGADHSYTTLPPLQEQLADESPAFLVEGDQGQL